MENCTTRSLGTLPVELLRSTLKHLDGDKRSLQACSLVCHFLHPLSYELLFNSARITHSKGCKGDRSLTSFSVFLPTAPLAASCLRSLHLLPGSMIRPEASLDLGCLYRCLNLLPNLRRLQLSSAPIRSSQADNYGHSFARLSRPSLDLIVHNPRTTFPHNPDPLAVLDIFATLGSLSISQVLQPFGMDEIPPEHRVVAKSLKITHTQAPVAAKCLRLLHAKLMPSSVESFELLAVDTSALTALDQPVRESGGGMRSCTLNLVPLTIFSTDAEISRYLRLPSLAGCHLLRTLHLHLSLPLTIQQRDRASLIIQLCFERIVAYATSLCELTVVFRVEPSRVQGDPELRTVAHLMPWSALDAVVRASATLHSVNLQFHNGHYGPSSWFSMEMQNAIRMGVSQETMRVVRVTT